MSVGRRGAGVSESTPLAEMARHLRRRMYGAGGGASGGGAGGRGKRSPTSRSGMAAAAAAAASLDNGHVFLVDAEVLSDVTQV